MPSVMRLLLVALAACHYEYHDCPAEADLYVPTGPTVEDACECAEGVLLHCKGACAGPDATTCEEPEHLEAFLNGVGRQVAVRHTIYIEPQALVLACE